MSTYLFGYSSALDIYRRLSVEVRKVRRTEVNLSETTACASELKMSGWLEWLDSKAHLIVRAEEDLRKSQHIAAHVWGSTCQYWPALRLTDEIYVSSPEFLFLQAAQSLDRLALAFLGCELCGRYCIDGGDILKVRPLTSKERIARFIREHEGARGSHRATLALADVIDGVASPMETALALRLTLPCKRGGRGIEVPELNRTIPLNEHVTRAYGFDHITPDLLWERWKLAMEYDSDDAHTGADRIAHDSRRRLVLETVGYDVITVTNTQMKSMGDFDILAEHVARRTHKRVVPVSPETRTRQYALAHELQRLATNPTLTCPK